MSFNYLTLLQSCYEFVTNDAPLSLVYYSHFSTAIVALILGVLVFKYSNPPITGRVLFGLSLSFVAWIVLDLITWTSYNSIVYMFFWSFFGITTAFIYLFCVYFASVFIKKKDISFSTLLAFSLLLLPVIVLTPTRFNLEGFSNYDCISIEGLYFTNYFHLLGVISFIWILVLAYIGYRREESRVFKRQILLMSIGILSFITTFFTATFLDSYLVNAGVTGDYLIGNYGLFGMLIFMSLLSYLIVRFKAFNIKLLATQALVVALVVLIGSQFFFVRNPVNVVLTAITVVMAAGFGYFLVRSVKREVEQREEIQKLANRLAEVNSHLNAANERLQELDKQKTEFVSIASHQLRTPLTAIKGYSSMMLEGSYGKLTEKIKKPVENIFESSQRLVTIIEDFLNITRIELGRMKYDFTEVNFREVAEQVTKELTPNAERKGLKLSFSVEAGEYMVHADQGKITQVVSNIIDNAIKYTPSGTIAVSVSDGSGKVRVQVTDSGVGIPKETLPKLFDKFVRADDAGKVNFSGTGLGLYVAKQMVEAHKGKIWAESAGKGKGTSLIVELPVKKG